MVLEELSRTLIATCIAAFLLAFINVQNPVVFSFSENVSYFVTGALISLGLVSLIILARQAMSRGDDDDGNPEPSGTPSDPQVSDTDNVYIEAIREDSLIEALVKENLEQQDDREISENDIKEMTGEKILKAAEIREDIDDNQADD